MKRILWALGLLLGAIVSLCGLCVLSPEFYNVLFPKTYETAVANGQSEIPIVREFCKLYPEAHSSISYFTGSRGPTTWQSRVGLHGRYILYLETEIELDLLRRHISKYSEPRLSLLEIESAQKLPDGRWSISYSPNHPRLLTPNQWKELLIQNGDLSVLDGIATRRDHIPGFDANWRNW
jgi:hypothetical protein